MGTHRQHRRERNPLPLAAAERRQLASGQVRGSDLGESGIDARRHLGSSDAEVLEAERDLALDRVVDGLQLGILEDEPDRAREHARRSHDDVMSARHRRALDAAAVKVRDEAVQDAQQGRLATAARTRDEREAAVDLERDVGQSGRVCARVVVGETGQAGRRHAITGAKSRRQATSVGRSTAGRVSVG